MATQDIKAIKVLSIITAVAVLEETQHKKLMLKQNSLIKITTCLAATLYTLNKKIIKIKKI